MNDGTAGMPRKRRWGRRFVRCALALVALALIFIGPWPGGNGTYVGSGYQQRTLARLDAMRLASPDPGALRIGVAELDITPEKPGHQLAGYTNQPDKRSRGVFGRVFARALTIESGPTVVTILTADVLMMHPRLAAAVLGRCDLPAEAVYFTASHTHSGPGQWASAWYEQWAIGAYDEQYFGTLADQLAQVVLDSRSNVREARVGVAVAHAPQFIRSRIDGVNEVDDRIVAIVFRPANGDADLSDAPLAVLVTYAAHATASGRDDVRLSPDYPGALVARLRDLTRAEHVLFAAGAVGDAAPLPPGGTSCESAYVMGEALAEAIAPAVRAAPTSAVAELASVRLEVDLPVMRVPLTTALRTSPVLPWLFDDATSSIHVLRIGPALLAGTPCDVAGGAARPVITWAELRGMTAVLTSFNGDYQGYFVSPSEFSACPKLEQRSTFIRGPWAGAYVADLVVRVGAQIVRDEPAPRADAPSKRN